MVNRRLVVRLIAVVVTICALTTTVLVGSGYLHRPSWAGAAVSSALALCMLAFVIGNLGGMTGPAQVALDAYSSRRALAVTRRLWSGRRPDPQDEAVAAAIVDRAASQWWLSRLWMLLVSLYVLHAVLTTGAYRWIQVTLTIVLALVTGAVLAGRQRILRYGRSVGRSS